MWGVLRSPAMLITTTTLQQALTTLIGGTTSFTEQRRNWADLGQTRRVCPLRFPITKTQTRDQGLMLSSTFPTVASKEVSMRQKLAVLTTFCLFIVPAIYAQGGQLPGPAKSPLNVSLQATQLESWTELALDKSGLPPSQFDAVLLGKYETPDYVREYWRVQWRPADPIDVYIVLPHGLSRPRAILYVYDYRFDTERFRSDVWCKAATQGGFAAVGFTSALSLQRQHTPRPMKEWFVSELQEALATSTHDVQMILNFLEKRGDIDATQVAMYGQGSGGTIAILAAAVDPRI